MELSYNNIELFVKPIFNYVSLNGFNLHHLKALILIVYGIVHGQSLQYANIARPLPVDTNHRDTKKRIYRFMNNKDIDIGVLMSCWCRFIVGLLYGCRRIICYVPVMVDITWVNGEKYLKAAIPFLSRSIAILFHRFTDDDVRKTTSQNDIEELFFLQIRCLLWEYKVVIIGDRGFRRASLLAFFRREGLHYVIRLCGNVWLSTSKEAREQYSGILGNISLREGQRKYMRNVLLQQTLGVTTHIVMGKIKSKKGKKIDPWYIATDLEDLDKAYGYYEKRMWIEEMFRDLKSRFHWCEYKAETPEAREALTFCLMISYTIVLFLDHQVQKTNQEPLVASYGKSSITWLGINFLKHRKASSNTLFRQVRRHFGLVADEMAA